MNEILAGSVRELFYSKATRSFAEVGEGPRFSVKALNFWEAQEVLDGTKPAVDRIRRGIELGLQAIDSDPELAKKFLAQPKAHLVNPLFDAIVEFASGN